MKFDKIISNSQGPVGGQAEIVFSLSSKEFKELSIALYVIELYKEYACKQLTHDPLSSDWCMFDFKLENNKVTITVKDGMSG